MQSVHPFLCQYLFHIETLAVAMCHESTYIMLNSCSLSLTHTYNTHDHIYRDVSLFAAASMHRANDSIFT